MQGLHGSGRRRGRSAALSRHYPGIISTLSLPYCERLPPSGGRSTLDVSPRDRSPGMRRAGAAGSQSCRPRSRRCRSPDPPAHRFGKPKEDVLGSSPVLECVPGPRLCASHAGLCSDVLGREQASRQHCGGNEVRPRGSLGKRHRGMMHHADPHQLAAQGLQQA